MRHRKNTQSCGLLSSNYTFSLPYLRRIHRKAGPRQNTADLTFPDTTSIIIDTNHFGARSSVLVDPAAIQNTQVQNQ